MLRCRLRALFKDLPMTVAGRSYARMYDIVGRQDIHEFLLDAVEASGGVVLYAENTAEGARLPR